MKAGRVAVGHPVDVATGEQFTAAHDVEVGGVLPLLFRRMYNTSFLSRAPSVLGLGWVHAFEATLTPDLGGFTFDGHDGERVVFDDVAMNFEATGSILNPSAFMELRKEGERIVVYHWHDVEEPVQKYVFDAREPGTMRLVARELPSGLGLSLRYDRQGRVLTVTQTAERRQLFFGYDDSGLLATLHLGIATRGIEQASLVARYQYDELRRLVAVYDAKGASQEYQYDNHGRLILERDRGRGTYRMSYDSQGRCIETGGDAGYQSRRFIYEPGRITRVLDSQGRESLYQYNDVGQVERRTTAGGAVFVTRFDAEGRIVAEIDPLGASTSRTYEKRGNLARKVFPNGAVLQYEYGDDHQPRRIIEPDGATWTLQYERGALVEMVDPFERHTRYLRSEDNQLRGAVTPNGQEIYVQVNEEWTEERIADLDGLIVRRSLDLYLNPTEAEDDLGPLGKSTYDALGRLIHSTRPDGSRRTLEYDARGSIIRLVDARGGTWQARYSIYGNCLEQIDPLGRAHQFGWDTEGRLTSITNPKGERAEFRYDLDGRLTHIHHFDGRIEHGSYDAVGRLRARQLADGTELRFERDLLGYLLRVTAGERELRHFTYDVCGSPLEATSPDARITFEYARGGLLTAETQNDRRVEYEYDARGLLSRRHFEGNRAGALCFEYDKRSRLRRFSTEPVVGGALPHDSEGLRLSGGQTFDYDARNQSTKRHLGALVEERYFDLEGRLRLQRITGVGTRSYAYDGEDALLERVDESRGRSEYVYDSAEQLTRSLHSKAGPHSYEYDSSGNLTTRDAEPLRYERGNRLAQVGTTHLKRNANAQLTRLTSSERDDALEWDALGQLVRLHRRDGTEIRFGYDAFGRRVSKERRPPPTASSAESETGADAPRALVTRYWWTGDDLLAEECGSTLTEYAMWDSIAQALWEDGRIRHVVYSQQGVPQEFIDDRGNVVWRGEYDDWGRLVSEQGPASCRLGLPGQMADLETGLVYNRFRYYLPEAGQYISPDPIGFLGPMNGFRFAPNAISWIDPLGLYCKPNHPAPPNNNGVSPRHGQPPHDSRLRRIAARMRALGYGDVRVNQQQTDALGQVAGRNRPDVSGIHPVTGQRINIEIDTSAAGSAGHQAVLPARDPSAINTFVVIDSTGRPISAVRIP